MLSFTVFASCLFLVPILFSASVYSDGNFDHLTNDTKCQIYLYTEGGDFSVKELEHEGWKNISEVVFKDPKGVDSKCNSKDKENKELILSYDGNLKLTLYLYSTVDYWEIKNITATYATDKSVAFSSDNMYASKEFSWSCGALSLSFDGKVNNITTRAWLNMKRFQVQPFEGNEKVVFFESYDCTTWFTIPLWMGFLTVSMFTLIAAIGVYLLFTIKTMDKFENPKGKTITVPVGE
ncbi:V-type proton ATPase subunit S1-like protein [Leptotrombidium deliense]|uniref:V-type proton ATPase subunit S1-like protein n=1 Tax=Leptotrombidium deliense TaxID=299467 RepID=A0A443SBS2_9ACAR|nr:V-type proton ATPase subunit S1-like protein [Leptotrombidium deliense]